MELEIENTEVVSSNEIQVEVPNSIEVTEGEKDYEVSVVKKEYTIIGDSIFIPSMYEDAPPWLKEFIDTTINVAVTNRDQSLIDRLQSMLSLLDYVPKNQYTEQINQIVSEDGIINSRIATLNSNFTDSINTTNATIAEINLTYASKNEAAAIAANMLSASLSSSGLIGSTLIQMQEAYADLEGTTAQSISMLESVMEGEINGNATAMETIRTYVGIDEAGVGTGTGLSAYLEDSNGVIGGADSQLNNTIRVTAEEIESKFEYNSTVNIDGVYKKSGFGLTTNYTKGNGTEPNPYDSEFWIDATRLKFTNSNMTGRSAPFTIDATGTDPQIHFNGKVSITSIPESVTKLIGKFAHIPELNSYLEMNPEVVIRDGDSYLNTSENIVYFWDGDEWISAEGKISYRSTVFKRSNTKPATPIGGNYFMNVPDGWSDGIPPHPVGWTTGTAITPVWASYTEFDNKTDYTTNPPVWTDPILTLDSATTDYIYHSSATVPPTPINTTDDTSIIQADIKNGWYNDARLDTVWAAVRHKQQGVWTAWEISRIRGEDGTNGVDGARGANGSDGRRGSLLGRGSSSSWPPGSTLTNVIRAISGSENRVYAGDTVIWTNTSASGGTEIYEYNGSSWGTNTALRVNGNAVISGTLYSDRIMAGHIGSAVTALALSTVTATSNHPNESWTSGTTVGSISYTNSSSSYSSILSLVTGRTGVQGEFTGGSCAFKFFNGTTEIFNYGWSPSSQDSKAFATTAVMPPKSTKTFYLKAVKDVVDAHLYNMITGLQISIIGVSNGG